MALVHYRDGNTYQYNLCRWYFCSVFRDESQGWQRRSPAILTFVNVSIDDGNRMSRYWHVGTYVQERVIGLGEATTSIHDIVHVLYDSFLADIVFENDRITL